MHSVFNKLEKAVEHEGNRSSFWCAVLGVLFAIAFFAALLFAPPRARADEPAAKAVEKAFDKAKASKAVDDAFAKVKAPAVKSAAKAVEEAFTKAKAKGKPDAKDPATPERLPMPREVQVGLVSPWYIDCPAAPCAECGTACKCVACVCESVTPATSHPPGQPWTGGPIPQGWEWVGTVGNGAWRKAGVGSVQVSSIPLQLPASCVNGQCGAVVSPVTFAASPCAGGNCPAPTTACGRR